MDCVDFGERNNSAFNNSAKPWNVILKKKKPTKSVAKCASSILISLYPSFMWWDLPPSIEI